MEDFDLDIQKNDDNESTLNYPLIIGIIVALLLIGGGVYWFLNRNNDDTDTTQQEAVTDDANKTEATDKVLDSTEVNQDENAEAQNVDENNTEAEVNTPAETATENQNNTTENTTATNTTPDTSTENIYFIVSGAFKDANNAQTKMESLKSQGYNAVIVGPNGAGLMIVAYEGFPNMEDAKTKLKEIRQSNSQAWIYKKQN